MLEHIARTGNMKHRSRAVRETTVELRVAGMDNAEAFWLKLREEAEQCDAAKAAERVPQARKSAEHE